MALKCLILPEAQLLLRKRRLKFLLGTTIAVWKIRRFYLEFEFNIYLKT